jgi:predicted secreted hydrolase
MRISSSLLIPLLLSGGLACDDGAGADAGDVPSASAADAGDTFDAAATDALSAEMETGDTAAASCGLIPEGRVTLPGDEALHDEPIEWWYWTGHLRTEDGRWFGFELVFFVVQEGIVTAMMAHHAITDMAAQTFQYDTEYDLREPAEVPNGFDFALGSLTATGGGGRDELHATVDDYALDLVLTDTKSAVLQHGDGFHEYDFGGYTYYFSRPRMAAEGTLRVGEHTLAVAGTAWFDHQWGDLQEIVSVGWDWFALQLDDHRELMFFEARAGVEPTLVGASLTDASCVTREISPDSYTIEVLESWTSPTTGCTWPIGWRIVVDEVDPLERLDLIVTPAMKDQELESVFITYWEGAATVSGTVSGRAYVELVGYCD